MRVLHTFPHALGAPGIGWTAWNQVDSLVRAGHEVHVVAASIARPVIGAASVTTSLSQGALRVPHRAIGRDRAFAWHDAVARHRLDRTPVDVVHLWPLAPGLTARAARDAGIPALREAPNTHTERAWRAVAHEVGSLGIRPDRTAHSPDAAHLRMEQEEWDAATGILAPSAAVADSFVAEGFAPERVFRHRYGYRPSGRRARVRSDRPGPLRAVYVGLGEPRKGLHHALAAWRASSASTDGSFTIVGRLLPAYSAAIADLLDHPSVRVVGFSREVEAALAAADVVLLPTVEEGSALVTYEAQAMGCVPLVSTAAGAVVDDGVHGLLHEPGDVATLTSQLDLLATDRGELARLSAAALAHAPELTWDAAAEQLVAAYRAAIETEGVRHADPR
ncbi:glycosyltransferase family 4 protein [Microbacterium ulmi]|uniref:Glycosyltransferase family 4 protein n=1 Tax=Microbacterium ulmi TaxID=179095 RepID=A0A7Y2Q1K4_9MICO|nr:glycosyltransferase family 4 protein [Microbacterium ulmi]NII69464.1 glycosyltransferase involved in cell wall biosynthesis [Microbacterium ulmi]NNH04422.1 glycosyltransferase family 4 protein [Microbacterium ulmi]